MKKSLLKLLAVCLPAFSGAAQEYAINWFKISGGAGTSSSGQYVISGTIGQNDATAALTGGPYSVSGGFWSFYSQQNSAPPVLGITFTATNTVIVYWPSPSFGFSLQVNTDLTTANWVAPAETVVDDGTIKYIIISPPAGNRFFRLQHF